MCCRRLSGSRRPGYCQANRPVPQRTRRPPVWRGWHGCRKQRLGVSAVGHLTPGTRVPEISWAGPGCRDMHARCSRSSTQGPQSPSPSSFPVRVLCCWRTRVPGCGRQAGLAGRGRQGPQSSGSAPDLPTTTTAPEPQPGGKPVGCPRPNQDSARMMMSQAPGPGLRKRLSGDPCRPESSGSCSIHCRRSPHSPLSPRFLLWLHEPRAQHSRLKASDKPPWPPSLRSATGGGESATGGLSLIHI